MSEHEAVNLVLIFPYWEKQTGKILRDEEGKPILVLDNAVKDPSVLLPYIAELEQRLFCAKLAVEWLKLQEEKTT